MLPTFQCFRVQHHLCVTVQLRDFHIAGHVLVGLPICFSAPLLLSVHVSLAFLLICMGLFYVDSSVFGCRSPKLSSKRWSQFHFPHSGGIWLQSATSWSRARWERLDEWMCSALLIGIIQLLNGIEHLVKHHILHHDQKLDNSLLKLEEMWQG